MMTNFDDMNKMTKDMMDNSMKAFAVMTKGFQDIATEAADYSKKSFDEASKTTEKLMAVKSFDKAVEVQTEVAKTSYEGIVAQSTKMTEMMTSVAKDAYKPFEAAVAKATK